MDPTPLFRDAYAPALQEHLRLQLLSASAPPDVLRAGARLIEYIDDRGYLCCPLEEFAFGRRLPMSTARAALELIQSFSPRGVGASSLRECLLLQADPKRCDLAILQTLLNGPLEKIERRDLGYFAKLCGVSAAEVGRTFRYLASLSPFPGSEFCADGPVQYIYPEIEIFVQQNALRFRLHNGCDLVTVNEPLFRSISQDSCLDAEDKAYIREKYSEAVSLVQELMLRRSAMEKLLTYLLEAQREYFLFPMGRLKPITMRQAAQAIGMNPSTVSRCVNGRYIQTRGGVIPLKQLFSVGLTSDSDTEVSPVEVKRSIRALIGGETAGRPLTDQDIVQRLAEEGVRLSRRTVAKYREQLGIPGSRSRLQKGDHP